MSSPQTPLQRALASWTQLLGAERCIADTRLRAQGYDADVGEYARRAILAALYPESVSDVQGLVRVANAHGIALYSISTGKNWGMGSRQPVQSGGVVVDLSRMNRIRTVNVDEVYVIVEPGVTQQALSDALASTPCIGNLTASAPDTSLVGNLLDKGIGLYRHRVDDLLGVEVVTGYGEVVRAGGYWPMDRPLFHFPSGLGPTLTPLFLQSNFGIVTACVLKLIRRPEMVQILYATVGADRLGSALALLKRLRSEHALDAVIKLYNAQAFHAYGGEAAPAGDRAFHMVGAVYGSAPWVRHVGPFVADALREIHCFDDVALLGPEALPRAPKLVQALASVFAGRPTAFAVERAFGLRDAGECCELDRLSRKGLVFVIPVVPCTEDAILNTLDIFADYAKRYDRRINTTINILSAEAVEMVSSMMFGRTREDIEQAHALKRGLVRELARRGIALMRLDIDSQSDTEIFTQESYRDVLVRLKRLFDPNNIIAPGRYIPEASRAAAASSPAVLANG